MEEPGSQRFVLKTAMERLLTPIEGRSTKKDSGDDESTPSLRGSKSGSPRQKSCSVEGMDQTFLSSRETGGHLVGVSVQVSVGVSRVFASHLCSNRNTSGTLSRATSCADLRFPHGRGSFGRGRVCGRVGGVFAWATNVESIWPSTEGSCPPKKGPKGVHLP